MFVLLCLVALPAQELPAPHLKVLTFMQLAAGTADAIATYRNDSRCYGTAANPLARCTEFNPISRVFVMKGTPQLAGYFVGEMSAKLVVPLLLDRHGRHTLARVVRYWGIGDNAAGVAMSLAGHHR